MVFNNDIALLIELDPDSAHGSVSGNIRITQDQWDHIDQMLDLRPVVAEKVIPPTSQMNSQIHDGSDARPFEIGYVNGGVLLIPANTNFDIRWTQHQADIAKCFNGHSLENGAVTKSNMAALATTIGSHEKFSWLPIGFNYRHSCFALGLEAASDIHLVHMTGFGERTGATTLSQWIEDYWDQKMLFGLRGLRERIGETEYERRLGEANIVRDGILKIIHDYELDSLARKLLSEKTGLSWA